MRAESTGRYCCTHGFKPRGFLPSLVATFSCLVLLCIPGYGQGAGQGPTNRPADLEITPTPDIGKVMDRYIVEQSVELGGRVASVNGSSAMYDTLLNQQSGPRLFQQSLMVRPMPNTNAPIDNLS
jgi:hypothetical protein